MAGTEDMVLNGREIAALLAAARVVYAERPAGEPTWHTTVLAGAISKLEAVIAAGGIETEAQDGRAGEVDQ